MNKRTTSKRSHDTSSVITTPTPFGSHSVMLADLSLFDSTFKENEVVCKDDQGYYVTTKDRLDSNLADPNRYNARRSVVLKEKSND
jgi:hypothetical protein